MGTVIPWNPAAKPSWGSVLLVADVQLEKHDLFLQTRNQCCSCIILDTKLKMWCGNESEEKFYSFVPTTYYEGLRHDQNWEV